MEMRKITALLVGGLATWSCVVLTPAQTVPIIGFLNSASREQFVQQLAAFHRGLSEAGYVEGQNVTIEYRWAEGRYDRLPSLAADLARLKPAMIVATGGASPMRAAKAESATIPILVVSGSDPGQLGDEARSRPGPRNLTGVTVYHSQLAAKRVEFVRELLPRPAKLALLVNPSGALTAVETRDVETAGRDVGLQVLVINATTENELAPAIASAIEAGADSLLISADAFFMSRRAEIVTLAAQHALPAVYAWREFVEAGGLLSYGPRLSEAYRDIGQYAGRILNGATLADLPIQAPRKFELMINLRTAKSLGLTMSPMVLARLDEAIE
jgi:putative ABC transport system substrate-binding protein